MERKDKIDALGAIVLVLIMMTLGINQVAIKLVNEGMAPVFQASLRSLFATPLILGFCLWRGLEIPFNKAILIPGLITGTLFAAEFALLFEAMEYTTVARASIFFYTMPFWVAAVAHFMIPGEKLSPIRILGLVLACAGVVVALAGGSSSAGDNAIIGDLMALVGATGWAGIALIARITAFSTVKPAAQLFYQLSVSSILLLPFALFIGDTFRDPTAFHWTIFAAQVLIVVCIGFLSWFWVLSIYPASDMASFSFLAPLFGVLFGWLILGEEITWTIIIALTLVAAGIVFVNRR
ncbi:MAG: DMT family transporter [Pseudomonadota bacterium]